MKHGLRSWSAWPQSLTMIIKVFDPITFKLKKCYNVHCKLEMHTLYFGKISDSINQTKVYTFHNRMHCKMVFNFTFRHDHAFKSCQTSWPLIGLRNLILIGQLRIWWKQTKAFFTTLAVGNKLNTECYVIQSKECKQK